MEEILGTIDAVQGIGFVGLLIVLAIPKLRRFVFNGNGKKEINELKDNHLPHLTEAVKNSTSEFKEFRKEMRIFKETLIVHNTRVIDGLDFIKDKLK